MKKLEVISALWDTVRTIIPLVAVLVLTQIVILKKPIHNVREFAIGFFLTVFGLHLFLKGAMMTLIPLGDSVGRNLVVVERKWIILAIGFAIGYVATLVEPGLKVLALEVEELSAGVLNHKLLINGVAVGFGG
ncbi:MAG: DUF1538 family protein, partial [Elusimicrobia bacterium]|nr:DUF1538 family protein [Elusimicrobiota bacterium]